MTKQIMYIIIFALVIGLTLGFLAMIQEIDHDKPEPEKETIDIGESAMVELGDGLWYNSETGIVYWWNGTLSYNYSISPTPYYAPNGLPYKYNPITKSLEEIE